MNRLSWHALLAAAALAAVVVGNRAIAVDEEPSEADAPKATAGAIEMPTTFRSSKLVGMEVRNPEGEDLGKIEDLVIDLHSGQVRYAALSFGGFLGVGDKLFAVPMKSMTFVPSDDDSHFVLDVEQATAGERPGLQPQGPGPRTPTRNGLRSTPSTAPAPRPTLPARPPRDRTAIPERSCQPRMAS